MCKAIDCCYNGGGICERVITSLNAMGICSWRYDENGNPKKHKVTREDILNARKSEQIIQGNELGGEDRSLTEGIDSDKAGVIDSEQQDISS